jgi:hypothetical protein
MELRTAYFTQKLLVEMTRFLLVFIEKLPVAVARLTCFALIFAFLYRGLLGRFVVRLFVLYKLLIPKERVSAQFAYEWPDVNMLKVVLVDILNG